jgi:N-acetylneuraminic acid mutarotase
MYFLRATASPFSLCRRKSNLLALPKSCYRLPGLFPMQRRSLLIIALLLASGMGSAAQPPLPPIPVPLSNNAVTSIKLGKQFLIFSFMGIGSGKTWKDISNAAYELDISADKWTEIRPVPGPAGRLAAAAASARQQIFLFGGYVVDGQGNEITVPDLAVYEPEDQRWYRGADIPTAVDDFVIGTYRDRYIYLVSGWSRNQAVGNVQVYDTEKNTWKQATPIAGTPVFGHAGALLDDTIIYVDGAYKNPSGSPPYIASDQCWMGKINHHDPAKIQWSKVSNHPGTARYRIAAGASDKDKKIFFAGGTDNPYNYNGIGYDGHPSEPSPVVFAWDLRSGKWELVSENTSDPTMDHHGLVVVPPGLIIVGGMEKERRVTSRVTFLPKRGKAR